MDLTAPASRRGQTDTRPAMAHASHKGSFGRLFDVRLDVRPPLTDEQIAEVPAKRGVFLLAAEDDQPILLTTAASLRARLRGRLDEKDPDEKKRSADLRAVTRSVHWKLAPSHFEMDLVYLRIARRLWPDRYAKMLNWKPAWFVHVRPEDDDPHFTRTRDPFARRGRVLGPFESGRSAEKFIDVIQDAFDLCRDVQCLRRSPHAPRCAYGQMDRCLCPCDGTVTMEAYRRAVTDAAEFAAGNRREHLAGLREAMKTEAAALRFERASAIKTRLERLAALDAPAYAWVAPIESFRFLLFQRSGSRRAVRLFLVDRGTVLPTPTLKYPFDIRQLQRRFDRMARLVAGRARRRQDPTDTWRVGLAARALFAEAAQGGVALRWEEALTVERAVEAVEDAAEDLGLTKAAGGTAN